MLFSRYNFTHALQNNIEAAGLRRPTDIQFRAIPAVMDGNDLMAVAQTGTGKTLAFALPIIELLSHSRRPANARAPRALILVPTHELAKQINEVFTAMMASTGLHSACIVGGYTIEHQVNTMRKNIDVVIATPGRMHDLARNQYVDLASVKHFVLDEADRMLEFGFKNDIDQLLRYLPTRRQTLFFSATISKEIKKLARRLVRNAIRIEIAPEDPVSKNIEHSLLEVSMDEKRFFLERLVKENPEAKILVFVRTQVRAERVTRAMERVGLQAELIHGGLERDEREAALKSFAENENRLLIATDVSARGLDIPGINFVVNYDMPTQSETYIHRIGRTGRGKQRGKAVSFCAPEEQEYLLAIEKLLGDFLPRVDLDQQEYMDTIDFSAAAESDWKTLIDQHQAEEEKRRRERKRKKK